MKLGMVMATAGAFAASFSFAGEAPKVDPAKGQQIVAQVCVACHGADGNSATPANPSLAGQHPEYLVKQLQEFKKRGSQERNHAGNGCDVKRR
jgi:cytochrome c553